MGIALHAFYKFLVSIDAVIREPSGAILFKPTPPPHRPTPVDDREPIDIDGVLESRVSLQVVGPAGAGKTTFLRVLARRAASSSSSRIPVFVPLSRLPDTGSLEKLLLRSYADFGLTLSEAGVEALLESGNGIVLLDGLDEALARTSNAAEQVANFVATCKSQTIVSTRPWAMLPRGSTYLTVRSLPMTHVQVEEFVSRWFAEETWKANDVINHLRQYPDLFEIVATPLLATVLVTIKARGGTLPTSMLELYSERLRLLLYSWDAVKGVKRDSFDPKDKEFFLRKLAYELHSRQSRSASAEFVVTFALKTIGSLGKSSEAQRFITELADHNTVLFREPDGQWGFGHLQYQEHLAALELKENPRRDITAMLGVGWWDAVVRMYAEMTRDISYLVRRAEKKELIDDHLETLMELLELAPNTGDDVVKLLDRRWAVEEARTSDEIGPEGKADVVDRLDRRSR